jgi:hypothetical protein
MGATQILHKPLKYEHSTYSENPISGFGLGISPSEMNDKTPTFNPHFYVIMAF